MAVSEDHKQNKKYRDILKSAREIFWKHGFKRVTVEEICQKAGVSKMTYYRYFSNKTELAKTVYYEVVQQGMQRFKEIMSADITPSEKIKQIVLMKLEGTNDISQEFLKDFYYSADSELPKYVEELSRRSWDEILSDFKAAQQKGWFRKDFKPEFLFYFMQKLGGEIYTDKNLLKLYPSTQDFIMELINFFMYGISPRN
jgi:AcrR family transcriptional regulator